MFGSTTFSEGERAAIQKTLRLYLGPEYIKYRPHGGGQQVAYLEGCKAVELANETFGFNGWSSSVNNITVDFLEKDKTNCYTIGVTAIVRVTLKDGTYHEDVGYGNGKGQSRPQVIEKAKKQACTDALKRALKMFGNSMGQCISDKEYLRSLKGANYKPPPVDLTFARTSASYQPDGLPLTHVTFAAPPPPSTAAPAAAAPAAPAPAAPLAQAPHTPSAGVSTSSPTGPSSARTAPPAPAAAIKTSPQSSAGPADSPSNPPAPPPPPAGSRPGAVPAAAMAAASAGSSHAAGGAEDDIIGEDMEMFLDLDMPGASDDEWGEAAVLPATGTAAAPKHSPAATPHTAAHRPASAAMTPSPGAALPSPHAANGHGRANALPAAPPPHRASPMNGSADSAAKRARGEPGPIAGLD